MSTGGVETWPSDPATLARLQDHIARLQPPHWTRTASPSIGGCYVCFSKGGTGAGSAGDQGWAAAVTMTDGLVTDAAVVTGSAGAPYRPGLLAAREGALLERALAALRLTPDVVLINAVGRDHPRRAGLAVHLGWALELASVGVTHRPLLADGSWPPGVVGEEAPLVVDGETVGSWLRTRGQARPVAVTAGWRTTPGMAVEVVRRAAGSARTPGPIRQARTLARTARAQGRPTG